MHKLNDVILYRDDAYYAAFPSIVARPDGELLVAFRRAPERRQFFADRVSHIDPNSYLVLVRSHDAAAPGPSQSHSLPIRSAARKTRAWCSSTMARSW